MSIAKHGLFIHEIHVISFYFIYLFIYLFLFFFWGGGGFFDQDLLDHVVLQADQIQVYVIFASFCAKYEPDNMYIIHVVFVLIDIKNIFLLPRYPP